MDGSAPQSSEWGGSSLSSSSLAGSPGGCGGSPLSSPPPPPLPCGTTADYEGDGLTNFSISPPSAFAGETRHAAGGDPAMLLKSAQAALARGRLQAEMQVGTLRGGKAPGAATSQEGGCSGPPPSLPLHRASRRGSTQARLQRSSPAPSSATPHQPHSVVVSAFWESHDTRDPHDDTESIADADYFSCRGAGSPAGRRHGASPFALGGGGGGVPHAADMPYQQLVALQGMDDAAILRELEVLLQGAGQQRGGGGGRTPVPSAASSACGAAAGPAAAKLRGCLEHGDAAEAGRAAARVVRLNPSSGPADVADVLQEFLPGLSHRYLREHWREVVGAWRQGPGPSPASAVPGGGGGADAARVCAAPPSLPPPGQRFSQAVQRRGSQGEGGRGRRGVSVGAAAWGGGEVAAPRSAVSAVASRHSRQSRGSGRVGDGARQQRKVDIL